MNDKKFEYTKTTHECINQNLNQNQYEQKMWVPLGFFAAFLATFISFKVFQPLLGGRIPLLLVFQPLLGGRIPLLRFLFSHDFYMGRPHTS